MTDFVYDGSFEGLLTAIFDIYFKRLERARILPAAYYQPDVFSEKIEVYTDEAKANRVWKGLHKKLSKSALIHVFSCYLSELPEREEIILSFVRQVFASTDKVEENYSSSSVLRIAQLGRQLFREKHRFEAFVRFQQLRDGTFYATIDPDFNVLPLITEHFVKRYANQSWIIYDVRRKYGMHYDQHQVQEVYFDFVKASNEASLPQLEATDSEVVEPPTGVYTDQEDLYQLLWQTYFQSVNIPARRNLKLHRRHVPIRYWKYLTEKWTK